MQISKNTDGRRLKVRHFAATAEFVQTSFKTAWIWVLYCPAKHRRKGYAKGLLTSIIKFAKEKDIQTLSLTAGGFRDADMEHDKLVKFYRSFGFDTSGTRYSGHGCRMNLSIK